MKLIRKIVCFLSGALLLAGCDQGNALSMSTEKTDKLTVSTDAVNYMHDWAVDYTLTDIKSNQAIGGGIVDVLEGPGSKGCCVSLPIKWQPGIQLKVEWKKSNKKQTDPISRVKIIEVPKYKQPGDIYVLFYPGDEVEIAVSRIEPGHPGWTGKEKNSPYQACMAKYSKNECNNNLPKYRSGSWEESARMMRRACTESAISSSSNPEENGKGCKEWQAECKAKWNIDKKMCDLDYKE
ncbi:DUF3304 domain-containing protein [Chromobacterium vaccinii]|uniref:DUF3304 domain-containing protein n=1 Tax=Chromobacterium vaccinii TaxID=1108595 RepID=UPI00061824C1|nr:DUF3304 domain-containing protein [Chromobacterium vaccinii]